MTQPTPPTNTRTMRWAIRRLLIDCLHEIEWPAGATTPDAPYGGPITDRDPDPTTGRFRGRVYEAGGVAGMRPSDPAPSSNTSPLPDAQAVQKPFIVIRESSEDAGEWWGNIVSTVEIWPFTEPTSWTWMDSIESRLLTCLHRSSVRTPEPESATYLLLYLNQTQDVEDRTYNAYSTGFRFQVFALAWMQERTFRPDPIETLQNWTTLTFRDVNGNPLLQTDPNTWEPTDARPGVYWRYVGGAAIRPRQVWGSWVNANIRGHVLAPDPRVRQEWGRRLIERLERAHTLYMEDGGPLEILEGQAALDTNTDPFRVGQVAVTMQYGVLRPDIAGYLGVQLLWDAPAAPVITNGPIGFVEGVTLTIPDTPLPTAPPGPTETQPGDVVVPTVPTPIVRTITVGVEVESEPEP